MYKMQDSHMVTQTNLLCLMQLLNFHNDTLPDNVNVNVIHVGLPQSHTPRYLSCSHLSISLLNTIA